MMPVQYSAYDLTIGKVNCAIAMMRGYIMSADWKKAEEVIKTFRSYPDCFFCTKFRSNLTDRKPGVCGNCPCHKMGESILGRPRACNGCYVVQPYAAVVKNAYWFAEIRSTESATAFLRSLEELLAFMSKHEKELRDE